MISVVASAWLCLLCCVAAADQAPDLFSDFRTIGLKAVSAAGAERDGGAYALPASVVSDRSRVASLDLNLLRSGPKELTLDLLPGARFTASVISTSTIVNRRVWVGRAKGSGPGEGVVVLVSAEDGSVYGQAQFMATNTSSTRYIAVESMSSDKAAAAFGRKATSLIYEMRLEDQPHLYAKPAKLALKGPVVAEAANNLTQHTSVVMQQYSSDQEAAGLQKAGRRMHSTTRNTQDLLVVYTQGAVKQLRSARQVENRIVAAVALANQAYKDSKIMLTVRLVRMAQVNYKESKDPLSDVTSDRVKNVFKLRNEVGADLVSLVVADCCGWCGIAWLYTGKPAWGFSAVQASCIGGRTLAHELGHNQGCVHDVGDKGGLHPSAVGWRRCDLRSSNFRTIMSYGCRGANRDFAVFSNPEVYLRPVRAKAGMSRKADCASAIRKSAGTLAGFRPKRVK